MRTALGDDPMTFRISARVLEVPRAGGAAEGHVAPMAQKRGVDARELRGRILRGTFGSGREGSYTGRSDLSRIVS
jgi:hypothetical protein